MNYNKTLCLPKTKFPMKAELSKREPEILSLWDKVDIYEKIREKRKGAKKYILHDGPPYANGDVHIGTALNKILKDIIIKFKTMSGLDAPFVPGWDCHGLPIEHQVMKLMGVEGLKISQIEIRERCQEYAKRYIDIQRKQFKRLGVFGDWEKPYLTLDFEYEAKIIEVFGRLVEDGYIYKRKKPIHWCPTCKTALAEAELEYKDHTSPSINVKFKLLHPDRSPITDYRLPIYIIIWTTTPWTLLGNVAIAFHPNLDYQLLKIKDEIFIMLKELVPSTMERMGIKDFEMLDTIKGSKFEGLECQHPFLDRRSRLILADYITKEEGTGCVHTAPGHGEEDYRSGVKYGLPILSPVNERGEFTEEAGELKGQNVFKANERIIKKLKETGNLIYEGTLIHSYPHCWRCKKPVIFRATEQWFISLDHKNLRARALSSIDEVEWIPDWGRSRIRGMVGVRPDWCISRQRAWGVPLPVFYCKKCHHYLASKGSLKAVKELMKREGSDGWFKKEVDEILPQGTRCSECGGGNFEKETDILDVWFESGVSHQAVLTTREELSYPSDLYLEGSDQHRGWFQSSLLTAIGCEERPPYKSVLTHGFMVDGEGKKMSKSLGNLISSEEMVERRGADITRLWVASENYQEDVAYSDEIMERMQEAYRRIRNTFRYLLGNLYDFDLQKNEIKYDEMLEIDRWVLSQLQGLLDKVTNAYHNFSFYQFYHLVHNFCAIQLSSFYFDILKDRLYTQGKDSLERRSAQTALYEILLVLVKIMAPILPYTTEEVWNYLSSKEEESVHLSDWPKINERFVNKKLEERWERLISIREMVLTSLEKARKEKRIGNSLEAEVEIHSKKEYEFLKEYEKNLPALFIVSGIRLVLAEEEGEEIVVKVGKASGEKCSRCWNYSTEVGKSKEHSTLCPRCIRVIKKYYQEKVGK
ncbi:isoleucine--tRNA ligase [bacterium]|nr:isoleucine--tRNA ligase [bacterium]